MTVSQQTPVSNCWGNNSATEFSFNFYIAKESELLVEHTDLNGIKSTLENGVDYSIHEIGNKDGSYITFPLSGSKYKTLAWDTSTDKKELLTISLTLPIEQKAEYEDSGDLSKKNLELSFDYAIRLIQILNRTISRAVKVNEGDEVTPDQLIENLNESKRIAADAATTATTQAENAQNSANIASEKADIATTKTAEVTETYNNAMADIQKDWQDAIDGIAEKQTQAETSITELKTSAELTITNGMADITANKEQSMSAINENRETSLAEIESAKSGAVSSINTTKDNAVSTVKQTGTDEYNKILSTGIDSKLGKNQITNCLLEVPQRIKADIVDSTLTVYAGSIAIVPYGTEAPTYSVGDFLLGEANNNLYKIVDIQYTADVDYPVLDQPLLFYTVEVQRDISTDWVPPNATEAVVRSMYLQISGDSTTWVHGEITPHCTSGTTNSNTTGYSLFYNTSANTCQRLNTSQTPTQSVCSLPIMQVNYNLNNPKLDSILNIFDCVGFIGSTVYFYKNISMLMGIGKNSDGSQKNIEYTTDKLFVHTISPTVANYFYYVGFENGVSIDPNSKKLIFDNPNTTFVGSSSLGTFINGWKMWNFRTGKWEFYSSTMNDGVSFQVYNAIFGRLWFEDGKIIRIYLNPTGMIKTDEEKGVTTSEQDSLSAMGVPVSGANLNSFRKAGTYYFSSSHTPTNIPTGVNGVLQVITNEERTLVKQIWFRQGTIDSNDTQTWIRTYACTNTETNTFNWSKWQLIPTYTSKDATNGYAKIGNTIIQWGILQSGTSNDVAKTVTLPTPFSNSNYIVTPAKQDAHNSDYTSGEVSSKSTTSFKIYVFKERAYNWIAVGY